VKEDEMQTYEFTLVLSEIEAISEDLENRLYEAGCDDALLGIRDRTPYLDFDRESATAAEALMTAIEDAERAGAEIRVRRVEPDDLVSAAEIGNRTNRSRESIRLLAAGRRGPGGFPAPVSGMKRRTRLWRWSEVADWFVRSKLIPRGSEVELSRAIAAVNGILELRRSPEIAGHALLDRLVG